MFFTQHFRDEVVYHLTGLILHHFFVVHRCCVLYRSEVNVISVCILGLFRHFECADGPGRPIAVAAVIPVCAARREPCAGSRAMRRDGKIFPFRLGEKRRLTIQATGFSGRQMRAFPSGIAGMVPKVVGENKAFWRCTRPNIAGGAQLPVYIHDIIPESIPAALAKRVVSLFSCRMRIAQRTGL